MVAASDAALVAPPVSDRTAFTSAQLAVRFASHPDLISTDEHAPVDTPRRTALDER